MCRGAVTSSAHPVQGVEQCLLNANWRMQSAIRCASVTRMACCISTSFRNDACQGYTVIIGYPCRESNHFSSRLPVLRVDRVLGIPYATHFNSMEKDQEHKCKAQVVYDP
jgi:hypothetical protein